MTNSRDIKDLNIVLQRGVNEFLLRCKKAGLDVLVTQTLRDTEYQDYLYAQGRTRAGKIITKAKGGSSFHNYGLAFDICKNVKGEEYSDEEFFKKAGAIWLDMGGQWGGNFKTLKDTPHFEFSGDLTVSDLKNGARFNKEQTMKWEEKDMDINLINLDINYINEKIEFEAISYENQNYIKIRDLEKFGLKVKYDSVAKIIVVEK